MESRLKRRELGVERRPVYMRLEPELVAWLDQEAKRQRRSRAYVVSQAVRLQRAIWAELEAERSDA